MKCSVGTKIVIVKADFGRNKYSPVCGDYYYDGNCTSTQDTTQIMKNLCGNQQTCRVNINVPTFPDLCYGIIKILRVWYQCVGDGKLKWQLAILLKVI